MTTRWERVARAESGPTYAEEYARRFADAAAGGADVHGEAAFVEALRPPPARVLDAGCGTGRIAVRLAERGYDVTGVDVDARMLAVARREAPGTAWHEVDLADAEQLSAAVGTGVDVVLLAGNVVPLAEAGTVPALAGACARVLAPGGVLVAGFGLDEAHLPAGCPVTPLDVWDDAARAAGLRATDRFAGWDVTTRLPMTVDPDGYAVSVHTAAGAEGER